MQALQCTAILQNAENYNTASHPKPHHCENLNLPLVSTFILWHGTMWKHICIKHNTIFFQCFNYYIYFSYDLTKIVQTLKIQILHVTPPNVHLLKKKLGPVICNFQIIKLNYISITVIHSHARYQNMRGKMPVKWKNAHSFYDFRTFTFLQRFFTC
jgi:hypothetical protein